jgi:hypothetical protein
LDLNVSEKPVKCCIWNITFYCAEIWTLRKVDHKYLESFEMWHWRRMEKINCTDRVGFEEILHRVKEESNNLHRMKRRKDNWIVHILHRNCLLKRIIEGNIGRIEVRRRGVRRRKHLLDDRRKREDIGN